MAGEFSRIANSRHRGGDERHANSDERQQRSMSGIFPLSNGKIPWRGLAIIAVLVFAICTVNAASILDKARRAGDTYEAWRAFSEEYSSWLGTLVGLPIVVAAASRLMDRPVASRVAQLIAAALLFSFVHVAIMVLCRKALWPLWGTTYQFHFRSEMPFEIRKDLVSFAWMAGVLWADMKWPDAKLFARDKPDRDMVVALLDGERAINVGLNSLSAVEALGNYIELVRDNGARQALRTSLRDVESRLAHHGFVRTHRRWLVRVDKVSSLTSTGNGDWRAKINDLTIPVSRRQPLAVERIRTTLQSRPLD